MKGVTLGTCQEMTVHNFVDTVFIDRKNAGGEMHRRLLWLLFLMQAHVEMDFPSDFQGVEPKTQTPSNLEPSTLTPRLRLSTFLMISKVQT